MKIQQQLRGNTAGENALIFDQGVLRVDVERNEIRLHDGETPGGWRIPNVTQISILAVSDFTATATISVPGLIPDSVVGKMIQITVAGTYTLPPLTAADVGNPITIQATVAGVIVQRSGADIISDLGADVNSMNLIANQIVRINKFSTAKWVVSSRY